MAGSCEYGDEPSGSRTADLVIFMLFTRCACQYKATVSSGRNFFFI
jgi:hypothetical protein